LKRAENDKNILFYDTKKVVLTESFFDILIYKK